jgi:lincosamide nucleotidyltransferase A/C/D/E
MGDGMDSHWSDWSAVGEFHAPPRFEAVAVTWKPPEQSRPSLFYRSTARLNILVWKVPLPRRVLVRLSHSIYRAPPMPPHVTVGVIYALQDANVRCWVTGGWGVDALIGRPSRKHRDLDLVVDEHDLQRAIDRLGELGYSEWYRAEDEALMGTRIVLQDSDLAGLVIDLHPVGLPDERLTFATGTLDGRSVPCMSLQWQLSAHEGYRTRGHDRSDFALLRALER